MIGATVDTQSTTRHFIARSSIAYEHERALRVPGAARILKRRLVSNKV